MGHVELAGIRFELPDGRVLLDDVGFRVGDGAKVALVGANGAGKTTLLRIITGEVTPPYVTFTVQFADIVVSTRGELSRVFTPIEFHAAASGFGFVKPPHWTRPTPLNPHQRMTPHPPDPAGY